MTLDTADKLLDRNGLALEGGISRPQVKAVQNILQKCAQQFSPSSGDEDALNQLFVRYAQYMYDRSHRSLPLNWVRIKRPDYPEKVRHLLYEAYCRPNDILRLGVPECDALNEAAAQFIVREQMEQNHGVLEQFQNKHWTVFIIILLLGLGYIARIAYADIRTVKPL